MWQDSFTDAKNQGAFYVSFQLEVKCLKHLCNNYKYINFHLKTFSALASSEQEQEKRSIAKKPTRLESLRANFSTKSCLSSLSTKIKQIDESFEL